MDLCLKPFPTTTMTNDFDKFLIDSGLKTRTGWSGPFTVTTNDVRAWLFAAYQAGVLSEVYRQECHAEENKDEGKS